MAELQVVRVFTGPDGAHGNPLGVFLDGAAISGERRQEIAADLGFSETVFVEDRATGELRIFTPGVELPFAGHPLVGTAWVMREAGQTPATLRPPAGEVRVREDGDVIWIAAKGEWTAGFVPVQFDTPADVEALDGAPGDADETYAWAWVDESEGLIRSRGFAPGFGIPEDEATGSAVLSLCELLGVPITVHQGVGSLLSARPLGGGWAEVGGTVAPSERRDYAV